VFEGTDFGGRGVELLLKMPLSQDGCSPAATGGEADAQARTAHADAMIKQINLGRALWLTSRRVADVEILMARHIINMRHYGTDEMGRHWGRTTGRDDNSGD
jgi:hypothetical protein